MNNAPTLTLALSNPNTISNPYQKYLQKLRDKIASGHIKTMVIKK